MPQKYFSEKEKALITDAIRQAEKNTSGEIRVHIESRCNEGLMDRAAYIFGKLKMHKTEGRNGVLFYLSKDDHQLAILGDSGINAVVEPDFWESIKETIFSYFREGDIAGGLVKGIMMAGGSLKAFFPYSSDDKNELSDELSYGE